MYIVIYKFTFIHIYISIYTSIYITYTVKSRYKRGNGTWHFDSFIQGDSF